MKPSDVGTVTVEVGVVVISTVVRSEEVLVTTFVTADVIISVVVLVKVLTFCGRVDVVVTYTVLTAVTVLGFGVTVEVGEVV